MGTAGRNVAYQAYTLQLTRALIVQRIAFVRRRQHGDLFGGIHERAHGGEAAVLIDSPTAGLARQPNAPYHLIFGGLLDLLGLRDGVFPGVVLLSRRR